MCGLKVNFNQPKLYIMLDKYKAEIFTKEVTLDIIIVIAFF